MITKFKIATVLLLVFNYCFSQQNEKENIMLKSYNAFIQKSYVSVGSWSKKVTLSNGLISREENYSGKKLMSIKKNIYDDYGNIIYEIMTYSTNTGYKNDTILKCLYKYDQMKRVIEKEYNFGMVEKFSKFDENSKPNLVERYSKDDTILYFWPTTENREYDSIGNLIKEVKTEIVYSDNTNDTIKKIKTETNIYKYDKFGYVIEIKRDYNPKENFPIHILGGLPLHEVETLKYKYNKTGLWTNKYCIIDGKKILIEKRFFQ